MFKDKVVIVTGGANGIGRCIAQEFRACGAHVYVIDKEEGPHYVGDISQKETLEAFAADILSRHDKVHCIINNALPLMKVLDECTYEAFQYALSVGVTAPFYLVKLFRNHLAERASIINISSSRDRMSQPQTESYTAAKGGIATLTHALAVSLSGKARVNSISPGWIDTTSTLYEGAATSRSCRSPHGYCQYGTLPLFRQSRLYHRREYLHRWWYDQTDDLPWRPWLEVRAMIPPISSVNS